MPEPGTVILGGIIVVLCLLWFINAVTNAPIVDDDYDDHERKLIQELKKRDAA